jgi:ClpX C4-type zinc finger
MDVDSTKKSCSFCGEQGRKGEPLVGGLGAFMCGDCLAYYSDMVAEFRRTRTEVPPPWDSMSGPDILGKLALIVRTGAQVDRFLVEWVQLARSRKLSWAEIGKALGVSRQAAWERFARAIADADADADAAQAGSA